MHTHRFLSVLSVAFLLFTATSRADDTPQQQPPVQQSPPSQPSQPQNPQNQPAARREEEHGQQQPSRPSLGDRIRAFRNANAGVAGLQSQVTALTTDLAESRRQLAAITTERDSLRAQLAEVETVLGEQRDTVRAQAVEIAQTVGIPQDRLPQQVAGDGDNVFDQWVKATGTTKQALYRQNRDKIRAEAARRGLTV